MIYEYDETLGRWVDTRTGEVVPEEQVWAEVRELQQETYDALDALTAALYAGTILLSAWQVAVAQELREAHIALALLAVGGREQLTPAIALLVSDFLRRELRYLDGFARDIAAGGVSARQAQARIRQYGNAVQASYWNNAIRDNDRIWWELNAAEHCPDCLNLAAGSPYTRDTLPTVPGAGSTRCRGNCKCNLRLER